MATKARHLKTPMQLWVADNRKRLGLSPADLATLTGVTVDTARGWEPRGAPSEDAITLLERRFGVRRPDEKTAPPEGEAVLAQAISELVVELRAMREEREAFEARMRAVESELESLRAPREGAASEGRSVLRVGVE